MAAATWRVMPCLATMMGGSGCSFNEFSVSDRMKAKLRPAMTPPTSIRMKWNIVGERLKLGFANKKPQPSHDTYGHRIVPHPFHSLPMP